MKYVKLRSHAYVNGVLRSPDEGPFKLNNDDAKRLFDGELADDVSDDFPTDDGSPPAKVTVKPSDPKAG